MKIGRSYTRMDNGAPAGIAFSRRSDKVDADACQSSKSSVRTSAVTRPLILEPFSLCTVCIVLVLATTHLSIISAQGTFSLGSTSFDCSSNLICLGEAHLYTGPDYSRIQKGRLSLLNETIQGGATMLGVAYYRQPIRLVDPSSKQSASFSTSFTIDNVWGRSLYTNLYGTGDGMAFVISGNGPSYTGVHAGQLGIFNSDNQTPNKSIVVEFDTFDNSVYPFDDISDNHVSFDFSQITYAAAKNASDVEVYLDDQSTVYAWVEYTKETQLLEVRISNVSNRPILPLLSYTVDLFDVVNEYMLVGFSSSASDWQYSNFYIGDWTFNWTDPTALPAPPPSIAYTTRPGRSRQHKLGIIVGISVGVPSFILLCILMIGFFAHGMYACRGQYVDEEQGSSNSTGNDPNFQIQGTPERFGYEQLSIATNGFSRESKLGQGGFGSVYRGSLPSSGIPVAVKKISCDSNQGEKEFMTEVSIISQLRHRNLIQLLGWCVDSSKGYYLLVYELMPNGSLDQALFGSAEKGLAPLSWNRRLKIVIGFASAIEYLHQGWKRQVIHRDIKSSNIMLDEDWNAMLGDFGFARLNDHAQTPAKTLVAGTIGYIAPEGAASGIFTERTDVFAFGVVVLEVACGRPALSTTVPPNEMVLVDWVWDRLSGGDLLSTMDKRLSDYHKESMEALLKVGLLCSHPNPQARPSMRQVVQVLVGEAPMPPIPSPNPTLVFNSNSSHVER